jgi:hypothetical protein
MIERREDDMGTKGGVWVGKRLTKDKFEGGDGGLISHCRWSEALQRVG